MQVNTDNIPSQLKTFPNFVLWKEENREDKKTKVPYQTNGRHAKPNDSMTWTKFSAAVSAYQSGHGKYDGIGFCLSAGTPIGIDLDHCRCPAFDSVDIEIIAPWAKDIIKKIDSYTEASPSGKGIRIFVYGGNLPERGRNKKLPKYGGDNCRKDAVPAFEIYESGRYLTVTGNHIAGTTTDIISRPDIIDAVYNQIFGDAAKDNGKPEKVQHAANVSITDILEKAYLSKNGEKIQALYNGDYSGYGSQSEADLALCAHLAFWLGKNPELMDQAFRSSGLMRPKWDENHFADGRTYGQSVIAMATSNCRETFTGTATPEDWSEPIPFKDYSQLPQFPVEAVPGICGQMVQALADTCQVDAGLPGSMMLAALSAAIGGKVKIDLRTHKEPANDYFLSVIGSGNRKTEINNQLSQPIYSYQRERQDYLIPEIRTAENHRSVLEKRLEILQKEASKLADTEERKVILAGCAQVMKEIEDNPVPRKPVYLVDDITPESLGQLMADNQERAAILSAEGGIFKIIAGLYHNGQANFDLFLKAHAGEYWSNNRIGREAKTMQAPALTLGLAVQPNVIEEIGKNSEFRERGLSARFLYSLCTSRAGYRTLQTSPVPEKVKMDYHKLIVSLIEVEGRYELTLSPDAQAVWNEFYNDVEVLLRPGGELEHLIDWGSKLPGAVARISGLLHFADSADGFPEEQIKKNIVVSACMIGAYYLEHAKAVFGLMKENPQMKMAKKILDYIKRYKPKLFKGRDLFNHTNCQSMQEVQPGLNILTERGYIRELEKQTTEKRAGRPEATRYEVNPKIFSDV